MEELFEMSSKENMAMKFRTVGRHIRESFKSLYRNGWMTFAAASAVTVTLILVSVFFAILINMNKLATDVENNVQINVHISLSADKKQQQELEKNIEKIDGVDSVSFSSKDDELKKLVGAYGKNFELFKQDNPLYDVFVVEAKEPTQTKTIAKKVEKLQYVDNVEYGEKTVDKLFDTLKWGRYLWYYTKHWVITNSDVLNIKHNQDCNFLPSKRNRNNEISRSDQLVHTAAFRFRRCLARINWLDFTSGVNIYRLC